MFINNIDSLFFSIDIKNYEKENQKLLNFLEQKKEIAKSDTNTIQIINIKNYTFQILPNGLRFHSYILHNENISISIAAHRSKSKNNYPVAIRIKSLMLWQYGYTLAYEKTINILKDIFQGEIINEKISRADLCCHTDNLNLSIDGIASFRGTYKKNEMFFTNRKLTGITFGTFTEKNKMCRIYDKSLEIKTSGKTWFNSIWAAAGLDIEKVWNVEFQIGRTFFNEYQIETVTDFVLKSRAMWEKLTTEFITYINLDDINISRCSVKKEWQEIQTAYNKQVRQNIIKRDEQMRYTAGELLPLLTGVLISYGACKFNLNLDSTLDDFKEDLKIYLKEKKDNSKIEDLLIKRGQYIYS